MPRSGVTVLLDDRGSSRPLPLCRSIFCRRRTTPNNERGIQLTIVSFLAIRRSCATPSQSRQQNMLICGTDSWTGWTAKSEVHRREDQIRRHLYSTSVVIVYLSLMTTLRQSADSFSRFLSSVGSMPLSSRVSHSPCGWASWKASAGTPRLLNASSTPLARLRERSKFLFSE